MENQITIEMIDDWAGAAMQGLLAAQGPNKELDAEQISALAYEVAISMARARGTFLETHGDELAESDGEYS